MGANPIAAFGLSSAESIAAAHIYEATVSGELSRHRWNFSRRVARLSRLVEVPVHRWLYLYQIPDDLLLARALYQDAEPVDHEQMANRKIATDATDPVLEYEVRPAEDEWRPHFMRLVKDRLEAAFIGALRKDTALRDRMIASQDAPGGVWSIAKALDAQEQTPPRLPQGPIGRARGRR